MWKVWVNGFFIQRKLKLKLKVHKALIAHPGLMYR